ncbi:MAG: cation:proton antiporter [Planctomycetota bacterium]|nr:MAG: cation:proton antiporter [Planctomycetota bacterium]
MEWAEVPLQWLAHLLAMGERDALVFALCLGVVLLAPLLASRLRIPGLVGLLVAGMLLGPSGFAILERDVFIERLGTIGLLFILGLAGLELDLHEFRRRRSASLIFGCVSFTLPQVLGTIIGLTWLSMSWPAALLLGSIFASHTLLTYPIAKRMGINSRDAVMIAVGATMVTDTAALLVLAGVAATVREGDLSPAVFTGLGISFGAFLAFTFFVLPRIAAWALRTLGSNPPAEFLLVVSLIFFGAWLSSVAGVAAMVGAFMTGLALNRLIPDQSTLMNRVQFVGSTLFIPFFLFSVGMLVDLQSLARDSQSWIIGAAMVLTVMVGKGLAAIIGGKLLGLSWDGSLTAFGLTLSQAAATLAVVLVGLEIEVFDQAVFNGALIMIFGTCVIASFITERYGRALAQSSHSTAGGSDLPQRLLIPLANPSTADDLMALSLLMRDKGSNEPISPLVVVRDEDGVENRVSEGERLLSHAVVHAAAAEVPVTPLIRVDTNVANAMVRAAKELRISTIVIGWHGHISAGERIFGSILDQVLEDAPPRVVVTRLVRPPPVCRRLVLAIPPFAQLEPGFRRSLILVRNMAQQLGVTVHLWCVGQDLHDESRKLIAPKEQVPVLGEAFGSWTQIRHRLFDSLREDDILVLLSAREGGVSWQPGLDRLPRMVASRQPKTNLVVMFAPLPTLERHQNDVATQRSPTAIQGSLFPRLSLRTIQQPQWQDAVADMVDVLPLNPGQRQTTAAELVSDIKRDTLRLAPGVVLVHTHSSQISQSTLLVGLHEEGISFPRLDDPVQVVLILVSRSLYARDHQEHLRRLAALARLAQDSERIQALRSASDDADIRDIIDAPITNSPPR